MYYYSSRSTTVQLLNIHFLLYIVSSATMQVCTGPGSSPGGHYMLVVEQTRSATRLLLRSNARMWFSRSLTLSSLLIEP